MKDIFVIMLKEFQQLSRDKMSLRLLIIMPLVQMFVLGNAITTEVRRTPIMALDRCHCPESREILRHIPLLNLFIWKGEVHSEVELRQAMDKGDIKIGLIIPPQFGVEFLQATTPNPSGLGLGHGATLNLLVDGQDANSASVARGYISTIMNTWAMHSLESRLKGLGMRVGEIIPIQVKHAVLFNPSLLSRWYMVPGIVVILVTMITALLTGFAIVREKENGTLEQLMVTPLSPTALVLGKALPYFILGLIELMMALGLALVLFRLPFRGHLWELVLFASAYMLSSLGIGILTSTIVRTQQQALFVIWFFLLFFLLLSGFFMPIENMPHWVQLLTYGNPVRYFMTVLREMILKGSGFTELWPEMVSMLVIGSSVFGLAVLLFKRRSA